MWVPETAAEIEERARAGDLDETRSFDAKVALPAQGKNASLAIDVAAMTVDGGVLLYGVGEDENKRPTKPEPITLAGAADRVDQIVSNSIDEVPGFQPREYPTEADKSKGYLLLIVPPSERAPHQVTVGGDLRFYGRSAKGNRILTEGEVARLYQRRSEWEQDRAALLTEAIKANRMPVNLDPGHTHAFVRPVAGDADLFERALATLGGEAKMHRIALDTAATIKLKGGGHSPNLTNAGSWERPQANEWRMGSRPRASREKRVLGLIEVWFRHDGGGRLFSGRATDVDRNGRTYIAEPVIAGNLASFLAVMGKVYEGAGYHGQVDIGVALTDLSDADTMAGSHRAWAENFNYGADSFENTARVAAAELAEPERLTGELLRLFHATYGQPDYTPFDPPPEVAQ